MWATLPTEPIVGRTPIHDALREAAFLLVRESYESAQSLLEPVIQVLGWAVEEHWTGPLDTWISLDH